MHQDKISLGIVDDHTLFRQGLASLFDEYDQLSLLFEARNGIDMQDKIKVHGIPDIVLMDINMPVMDGYDSTVWLKTNYPNVHILALSMYEDDISIIKMLRKGAGGYVLKECNAEELIRALTETSRHGYYISDIVSGRLLHSVQMETQGGKSMFPEMNLSPRELEFLQLCCTELTYKEIAYQMKISPKTIDGHRESLFEKLQIKSRTGLVLYAIKNNLIKLR